LIPPRHKFDLNRIEPTEVLDRICCDACAVSAGCIEDGSVCQRPAFSFQVRLIQAAAEPGSLPGDEPHPASLRGGLEVSQPDTRITRQQEAVAHDQANS
jgi:hypothetical protein